MLFASIISIATFLMAYVWAATVNYQMQYRQQFNDLAAKIMQNIDDPQSAPMIDMPSDFVAIAVGPPARGKSFMFKILEEYARDHNKNAVLVNAGDIRRIWETMIIADPVKIEEFFKELHISLQEKQQWVEWLSDLENGSTEISSIPSHLFETRFGKSLNNYFAKIAISHIFNDNSNAINFFDATNTDQDRREMIINQAIASNKPVLFIENFCVDPNLLLRNFITKVNSSGDYKKLINAKCPGDMKHSVSQELITATIFNFAEYLMAVSKKIISEECKIAYMNSLNDILKRDLAYLKKYVPMHTRAPNSAESTLELINRINNENKGENLKLGYVQYMNRQCNPMLKEIWRSNVKREKGDLISRFQRVDLSPSTTSSSPENDVSRIDTYSDRKDIFDESALVSPRNLMLY